MRGVALACLLSSFACSNGSTMTDGGASDGGTAALSVTIGPISLVSGEEKTVCTTVRLPNATDVDVAAMTATLLPGSHHLILYRSTATVENPALTPCQTFDTVMQGDVPLLIVGTLHNQLTLPSGASYHLPARQMVKIEAHYINASQSPIDGQGTIVMTPRADGAATQTADLMLCGSMRQLTQQGIPPNQASVRLNPGFYAGGGDVDLTKLKVFGFTSHEHHLGSGVTIAKSTSASDPGQTFFTATDWSNTPLSVVDTNLLTFAAGEGLRWQCSYDSLDAQPPPTGATYFGPSALQNEMCFIAVYYYPSVGRFIGPNDCAMNQ
jgi:hypothetical protein